jgi:hypothetical protein
LRCSFNDVADRGCFRFFFKVKILKFIVVVAELACPNKLLLLLLDLTEEV